MAARRKAKAKTLAGKVGVPSKELARKIAIVKGDDPSLSSKQAAGKAAGILRGKRKRGR